MTLNIQSNERNTGKSWECNEDAWGDYLNLAIAFGYFNHDVGKRTGDLPSSGYLSPDTVFIQMSGETSLAFGAALQRAIATVKARAPLTLEQEIAFKSFEFKDSIVYDEDEYPNVRTIRTRLGSFDVDLGPVMALAEVANAGCFIISNGVIPWPY